MQANAKSENEPFPAPVVAAELLPIVRSPGIILSFPVYDVCAIETSTARALGHKCKRTNISTNANGLTHTEARVLTDGVACARARTHVHTSESLTVVVV